MLLNLIRFVNTGVLTVKRSWDNTKASLQARCGGPVGVREHIKGRIGNHGNTGGPNVSTRANAGIRSTSEPDAGKPFVRECGGAGR